MYANGHRYSHNVNDTRRNSLKRLVLLLIEFVARFLVRNILARGDTFNIQTLVPA